MLEFLDPIVNFIEQVILTVGYPGIFLTTLIENIFPPIPTEAVMPFVGILAAQGDLSFAVAWAFAFAGHLVGAMLQYSIGMLADAPIIRGFIRKYGRYLSIKEEQLDQSLALFNRYGGGAVIVGRMIPVGRTFVSLTAGLSRMKLWKFLLYTALSGGVSAAIWMFYGYIFRENWEEISALVGELGMLLILPIGLILLAVAFILYRRSSQRRSRRHTATQHQ